MVSVWIIFAAFAVLQPFAMCKPVLRMFHPDRGYSLNSVQYESLNRTTCDEMEAYKWHSGFHECFMDRKYKDGGQDLNKIIDRILDHAETCVENSTRDCQPDIRGFKIILNKVIEQMKDYSVMYMENIFKGRENVTDLKCIEETVSFKTYESCFEAILSNSNLNNSEFQSAVHEGLSCANRRNGGCSRQAKITLNRIVRTVLHIEHPSEEYVQEDEPTTTIHSNPVKVETKESSVRSYTQPPTTTTRSIPVRVETKESSVARTVYTRPPTKSSRSNPMVTEESWVRRYSRPPTTTPAPPPPVMRWYDYIFQPFISAWNWITSIFG